MAFKFGQDLQQVATTATAGSTTTLTNISKQNQVWTGTNSQTVVLPDATTMSVGQSFSLVNQSSLSLTLNFNGGSPFADASGTSYSTIYPHQTLQIKLQTAATAPGTWIVATNNVAGVSLIQPTVQKFLSGSGTYTTPANVAYIVVEMVGGGGGGSGSGSTNPNGGTGGNTTFGSSLLIANGGSGVFDASVGGTATVNSPAIQIAAVQGGQGFGATTIPSTVNAPGGIGASSPFGGAGAGVPGAGGIAAIPNTGSGGGGGGTAGVAVNSGAGGGAGGYLRATITNPSLTYSYAVGAAGVAGTAGTNGTAGAAGGSGVIIVTEYYNQTIASGVTVTASTAPTVQTFTSGSGTYNRPAGVQYITVEMIGGGGGGCGSGSTNGGGGADGGNSTFGSSFLTAGGGSGSGSYNAGTGGSNTINSPAITIVNVVGGTAGVAGIDALASSAYLPGGVGAATPFGGSGSCGLNSVGTAATANTGAGGGGASAPFGVSASLGGGGGGGGGYLKAIVNNPSTSYSYSVGSGGTGGTAGTSGFAGGNGGSGVIIITEYYTVLATGGFSGGGANVPTVQKFLSGSGTYTTPSNVISITVEMVGGGGGGSGSGTGGSAGAGGNGTATTFGANISCPGGGGGIQTSGTGGAPGGACTVSGALVIINAPGNGAGGSFNLAAGAAGTAGASSPFGGGANSTYDLIGAAASANTGSGGSGGGQVGAGVNGAGGASGSYLKAIINNPLSTYSYTIGTGGAAGTAGSSGLAGGAGAAGIIIVTEYYANGAVGTATNVTGIVAKANGGTGSSTYPGDYYYSGYYPNSTVNYWSSTNTSIGDFSTVGSIPTITPLQGANITVTNATSNLPGFHIASAPRTGTLKISCVLAYVPSQVSGANPYYLSLIESTTSTTIGSFGAGTAYGATPAISAPVTIVGYFNTTSGTPYNFKIQTLSGSASAAYIGAENSGAAALTFTMEYIN